ncbi:hypothetical protein PGT21_021236 [Puccinia graminis f. sp. tritici]|uniref:Uncharacterized protein n=1 Tax=Puccinia graminis f. sp. tritici TaxID=56615 RepID=A0A5B0NW84_PUCGR|nr:hypothetical protein PGT21_021236 [Puccinia graminis f. sp. tritici]KAA1115659.1 hypothetical protein PGTUg99_022004 [Puccinia graminis f. sp. tritici]
MSLSRLAIDGKKTPEQTTPPMEVAGWLKPKPLHVHGNVMGGVWMQRRRPRKSATITVEQERPVPAPSGITQHNEEGA